MKIVLFMFVSLLLLLSCSDKKVVREENMEDSVEYFIKALNLKAEGEYSEILVSEKHKANRVAPKLIVDLIETQDLTRMEMRSSVEYKGEIFTASWFFSEIAFEGKPDEVLQSIHELMSEHKFSFEDPIMNEHGYKEYHFRKEDDIGKHHFLLTELEMYVGIKKPISGSEITYRISSKDKFSQPTVGEVLKVYPEIICPELPDVLMEYMKDRKIGHIGYGGTWERYYTWSVTIPSEKLESAKEDLEEVTEIIKDLGYELWEEEKGVKTYQKKGDAYSFIYLSIEDERVFYFRFQPYS
jgi:hypothetical protein